METTLNFSAILLAGLVNMAIGALWYSPLLFGNIWMKGVKLNKTDIANSKGMGLRYAVQFLMGLFMVYVLAHYIDYMQASTASQGAEVAFWPWAGFMLPLMVGEMLWSEKPFSVFIINASHYLFALMTAGIILAVWQ